MKKSLMKALAMGLTVTSILSIGSVSAKAATTSETTPIFRNIPNYPFTEIGINTPLYGSTVVTKDNLSMEARKLYAADPVEGEKVISIMNHAKFFAEKYYENDGRYMGRKQAYEAAYVGVALSYYLEDRKDVNWAHALYLNNGSGSVVQSYNSIGAMGELHFTDIHSETMIAALVNSIIDAEGLCVSGNGVGTETITRGGRALTEAQTKIKNNNYAFFMQASDAYTEAIEEMNKVAMDSNRRCFNNATDAVVKASYGARIYLAAKRTGVSEADAKQWVIDTLTLGYSKPSKVTYAQMENALVGFENAKTLEILNEDQANKIAVAALNNHMLIKLGENDVFQRVSMPTK